MLLSITSSILFLLRPVASVPINDEARETFGCKLRDTRYIDFFEPLEPQNVLSIGTVWFHYARDLQDLVPEAGFQLITARDPNTSHDCGWYRLEQVRKWGVNRGHISFKRYRGVTTQQADYSPYKGEVTEQEVLSLPSQQTIQRAKGILVNHAPTRDLLEIFLMVAGPIVGAAICLTALWALVLWLFPDDNNYVDLDEEIEMTPFSALSPTELHLTQPPPYFAPYRERVKDGVVHTAQPFGKAAESGTVQEFDVSSIRAGESYCVSQRVPGMESWSRVSLG